MQSKAWQPIATDVLKAARELQGWSYERTARELGVSSKTYERYEKGGRVPLDMVGEVIAKLALDIEHGLGEYEPTTAEVLAVIRQAAEAVEQLTAALRLLDDRLQPAGGAPASSLSSEEVALPL